MTIAGISIVLILGIVNLILILFQAVSGLRLIKVKPRTHRASGLFLTATALAHGLLATLANW
jgi:hypothetical protein